MSDVFISYSRKDIAFARLLQKSLQQNQLDIWIDWERIPVGQKWWKEICEAIASANVFMFIISKTSISSTICKNEIDEALKNNKRIIPIVVDDLKVETIKEYIPDLPQFNWIIFQKDHIFKIEENETKSSNKPEDNEVALPKLPQFEEALQDLSRAIHTDWDWVKFHTQLQVDALRWKNNQQNSSYLVRGKALEEAEQKLIQSADKDPRPSVLQSDFVTSSRQEDNRIQKEQLLLDQKLRKRQRFALWAVGIGLVIALALGGLAWQQRNEARLQAKTALSGKLVSDALININSNVDLALLLNVEAFNMFDNLASRSGLQRTVMSVPRLLKIMHGHQLNISSMATSPDGKIIATGGCLTRDEVGVDCISGEIHLWQSDTGTEIENPVFNGKGSEIVGLSFDEKGEQLFAVTKNGILAVWDIASQKWVNQFELLMQHAVWEIAFSPNRHLLATGGGCPEGNCTVEVLLWDLVTQKPMGKLENDFAGLPGGLAFTSDSSVLAVSGFEVNIALYQITPAGGVLLPRTLKPLMGGTVWTLAFSPDGSRVYASGCGASLAPGKCNQGEIDYWDWSSSLDLQSSIPLGPAGSLIGQNTYISSLAIASDNKTLASGSLDNSIQLWDLSKNSPIGDPLQGLEGYSRDLQFDLSNEILFSINGKLLTKWSVETNPLQVILDPGGDYVRFGPDSQTLLFKSGEQEVKTLHLKTGAVSSLVDISGSHGVTSISFLPNNTSMRIAEQDNTVTDYDIETGGNAHILHSVENYSFFNGINSEATLLSSYVLNKEILVWDIKPAAIKSRIPIPKVGNLSEVTFSPDDKYLAYGLCLKFDQTNQCINSEIHVWNFASASDALISSGLGFGIKEIEFIKDGQSIVFAGSDKKLYFQDIDQPKSSQTPSIFIDLSQFLFESYAEVDHFDISSDGKTLVVLDTSNANVILVDLATKTQIGQTIKLKTWVSSWTDLQFTPDNSRLIASSMIVDAKTGQEIVTLDKKLSENTTISPDGRWLAVNGEASISLWDLSKQPIQKMVLNGHASNIISLAFTSDGSQLFSLSKDNTLDQWDIKTGKLINQPIKGYLDNNVKNILSPDGKWLVSAVKWITDGVTAQSEIRFWNLTTGSLEGDPIIVNTADKIPNLAFSADGKVLGAYYCTDKEPETTICTDTEIILWEAATHQSLGSISTQEVNAIYILDKDHLFSLDYNSVSEWTRTKSEFFQRKTGHGGVSLAISHDQKIIAVGGSGGVDLWDADSGKSIGPPFEGEFGIAYSLDFSPDDKYLAAGTNSGTSYVWQLETAHWVEKACQMANRNLSQEEWKIYLGDEPYRLTCPNNP